MTMCYEGWMVEVLSCGQRGEGSNPTLDIVGFVMLS